MDYAQAISDEALADVADLVAARRPIPAIIVEAILLRLQAAEERAPGRKARGEPARRGATAASSAAF